MKVLKYPFLDLGKVNEPYFDEMCRAAERVIRSGRYIGGEECTAFEAQLGQRLGVTDAVGTSNGLDALRLILRAYIETGRMRTGDEVIVPANTYIASFLAISDNGLVPVPVDVDPITMNIDTGLIESLITEKTRAIMTVHLYGRVAWDERLKKVARQYDLLIIEDCAQALGARSNVSGMNNMSRMAGALGDAAAISFYPTKNIGALGDAGAVVTSDKELAKTVRTLANYGSDRRYHNVYLGYNCRLDPIQAALLGVKISHTDEENADRFERALAYSRTIDNESVITPMLSASVIDNVWHQYVIRVTGGKRDRMMAELEKCGVGTDIHYPIPPHMQPCYSSLRHGDLPVTERLASEILSLPIGRGTSVSDVVEISKIINGITGI